MSVCGGKKFELLLSKSSKRHRRSRTGRKKGGSQQIVIEPY